MNNFVVLLFFIPILTAILLLLNVLLAPHNPDEAKVSAYECGYNALQGQTRSIFHIHFYVVAMLFLVFDLEVLLLYPLAVTLYQVSAFGFSVALIFFIVLTIGFILEIGSGAISLRNSDVETNFNPLSKNNSYKNKKVPVRPGGAIKQKKANFSTSAANSFSPRKVENPKVIATKSYWETIHEKDIGQETDNPHLIARRHLSKGGSTDVNIINLVQSHLGHTINLIEFNILRSIKPVSILFNNLGLQTKNKDQVISSNAYNAKVRSKLNVYIGGTNKSIAGVYIWTNLKTGEQNVGSSINLYTRLRSYFKPSIVNEGNRLINQSMKKFGIENFKLDLYIINTTGMVNSKIRALTLCLEQYYIFFLNPSLNSVKVAGSNPIVEHTKEHIASIKKANSKPIYVYKDNTLIYQADSANILKKEINISQSTITKCIKNPSFKCFKFLTISHVGPNSDVIIKK